MKFFWKSLKVAAIIAFVINTGVFSYFPRSTSEVRVDPVAELAVYRLGETLLHDAERQIARGVPYSPYDYFRDLTAVYNLADTLHVPVGLSNHTNTLQALSYQFIGEGKPFSYDDIDKARDDNFKPFLESRRLRSEPIDWKATSESIISWLFSQYLLGAFPALALFLCWMAHGEEKRLRIRNPLSLFLMVLVWPLPIAIVFRKWVRETGREYYARIELQRTKERFFTLLSQDEIAAAKRFAKSNLRLGEWRKELLAHGFSFHRSFALATAAFVFCVVVMNLGLARETTYAHSAAGRVMVVQGQSFGSIPHITPSGGTMSHDHSSCSMAIVENHSFQNHMESNIVFSSEPLTRPIWRSRKIFHIPVFQLVGRKITDLLTYWRKNERDYSWSAVRMRRLGLRAS